MFDIGRAIQHYVHNTPVYDNRSVSGGWPFMRTLALGRGVQIAAALVALPLLCPVARGDDTPTAPRRAWIGVFTRGLSNEWREREDYWARGVMVVQVARGSPADQAGMGPGDVLVSINSHTLEN